MKKIVIISLNFNPGHFSHLIANYKLVQDLGFFPCLMVHPSFNQMDVTNDFIKINTIQELFKINKVDASIFWFPSVKNIFTILMLRFIHKSEVVYVFHEPFESFQEYYKAGFSLAKIGKIVIANLISILTLFLSNKVVLPSDLAMKLYIKKYSFFNKNFYKIPLLFDDEYILGNTYTDHQYISYIGTIAADHAFDKFVDFIVFCMQNGFFPEKRFLIATSSVIPDRERKILEPHLNSGLVVLQTGRFMQNDEINSYYRDSCVVWNAYNRSMQSGVLPKAYMHGAAVIVLAKNANEFIINNVTGMLVNNNGDLIEIKKAVEYIVDKPVFFEQNCRAFFLNVFYYKSHSLNFQDLI